MQSYGGSFVQALAECLDLADHINYAKLEKAFPEYFEKYTEMAEGKGTSGSDDAHEAEQEIARDNTLAAHERYNNN